MPPCFRLSNQTLSAACMIETQVSCNSLDTKCFKMLYKSLYKIPWCDEEGIRVSNLSFKDVDTHWSMEVLHLSPYNPTIWEFCTARSNLFRQYNPFRFYLFIDYFCSSAEFDRASFIKVESHVSLEVIGQRPRRGGGLIHWSTSKEASEAAWRASGGAGRV